MKVFSALVLLWAGEWRAPAQLLLDKLTRSELYGHSYVRLSDWARASDFDLRWRPPGKEVYVTNRTIQLVFTLDSRRAEINGVSVWLSVPIAHHIGVLYISPLDLKTMIYPVLYPARNARESKIKTICLDPGHGGKDPGNQVRHYQEKRYALLLAKEVQAGLGKAGFKVVLTRTGDSFVELPNRPEVAQKKRADLFVSLHYNSVQGIGSGARGVETYCLTPAGAFSTNARVDTGDTRTLPANSQDARNALLAYRLQRALVTKLPLEDRGVRRARFAVLRTATVPAVLVECGFMTDPSDAAKIYDPAFRRRVALAIVDGLVAYQRIVERPGN